MPIDLSPDQFRELGYRAIDLLAEYLAALPDAPARPPVPDDLKQKILNQPLPQDPQDPVALLEKFSSDVLPYPMGNSSSRFFAWVNSPAAPLGILAELLAAGLNSSVAGGDHAATYIEHAVLNWLKAIMTYPAESAGLLTSGGSMANLVGLAVMRHVMGDDVRQKGLQRGTPPLVVYASTESHSSIQKAVEMLGIGNVYLRKIPADADQRMNVDRLQKMINADKWVGLRPACVVASAGTVNTGAIDPLLVISEICEIEEMWFHVDGAYGGVGILAQPELYAGIERANSLAIDPHKWLYMPVECGCVLVRHPDAMRDAFSLLPSYLRDDAALPWFAEFGPQQTRGFKALKLWMVMQQLGVEGYRDLIKRDIALAKSLQERIRQREDFTLAAAGPLSVTCFRYTPTGVDDLDTLNRQALETVQREGQVFLTSTELDGEFVLRACIVNFRTTEADLDILLDTIAQAGQRVVG